MSNDGSHLDDPGPLGAYSDAARRCSDIINLHITADTNNAGRWAAIRLSDGGSDGRVYDTKADAVRFQLHEMQCAYVCIPPTGMPPREAEIFLRYNRQLYDAGFRMPDPAVNHAPPITTRLELPRGINSRIPRP